MLGALYRLIFVNLFGNLLGALTDVVRAIRAWRRPRWVRLVLDEPLPDRPAAKAWFRRHGQSLDGLARTIDELVKDPRLVGVVVEIEHVHGGWARAESLRAVLARLEKGGKRLVAHLSSPSLKELFVACAASKLVVDESGPVAVAGVAAEAMFFGAAFAKAGVAAQAEYRGKYKSFAETFTRADMSPAHREAVEAMLDGVEGDVGAVLARARGVTPARALELLRAGPYTAEAAVSAGLIDAVLYADEVEAWLGAGTKVGTLNAWRAARPRGPRWAPLLTRRAVAVVKLHGAIVGGEGAGLLRGGLGSTSAIRAIDAARENPDVAAIVLHIDSRGGSAPASDLIWRSVIRAGKVKPVVAYLDDVAASGGYYIACAAQRIVAQPGTLTGSIGVVAGKLSLAGLYAKLGLHTEIVARGPAAAMNSAARGYSDEERARLAAEVDALYRQFVAKVASGRKLAVDAAEAVAQGRVWTGTAAHERGLVDEIGGLEVAVEAARRAGRKRESERLDVVDVAPSPRHRGLVQRLIGGEVRAALAEAGMAEVAGLADERFLAYLSLTVD